MANVSALNLNGTDYDVEDTTSRGAQLALDEKCNNIGTQIEQELEPVTTDVATLKEQSQEYATRITALENRPTPFAAKTLFESEEGQRTGNIAIPQTDRTLFALIIEVIASPADGKQALIYRVQNGASAGAEQSINITLPVPASYTAGAIRIAEKKITIVAGSTALSAWRLELKNTTYSSSQSYSPVTTDNSYCAITRVIGLYQG